MMKKINTLFTKKKKVAVLFQLHTDEFFFVLYLWGGEVVAVMLARFSFPPPFLYQAFCTYEVICLLAGSLRYDLWCLEKAVITTGSVQSQKN